MKNKRVILSRAASIILTVLLVSSLAITAFAAEKTISVSRVQQAKDHWCWAACGEMIGTYVNSNSSQDQWSIVKKIKGTLFNPYPDEGGTDTETEEAIEIGSDNTVDYECDSVLSFVDHQTDIDNWYPLCAKMVWDSSGAHVVVVAGYRTNSTNMLYLIDPWYSCGSAYYSYTALINGATIQSGTGKYTKSFHANY